jgi:adenosylcobinamide-GDP ribazoletransferase
MKDSRIGAYGVLALILVIGLKWLALAALIDAGALWMAVLVPAMLSRGAMAGMMAGPCPSRGRRTCPTCGTTVGMHGRCRVRSRRAGDGRDGGACAGVAVIAVIVVSVALARLARSKIGGQTG